jgi:hypothetical protein
MGVGPDKAVPSGQGRTSLALEILYRQEWSGLARDFDGRGLGQFAARAARTWRFSRSLPVPPHSEGRDK